MDIFIGIITILFLDIVLSVDNAILIASTTRNLEKSERRKARIIGSSLAVLLRLVFVILIMFVLKAATSVPVLYIIGGILLIVIGIMITKKHDEEEVKVANSAMKAIVLILAGDVMLSFDNSFIIADVASGMNVDLGWKILIIAAALLLSLFILLFFAKQLTAIMEKNQWIVYIACWLLISVGIEMMFKDQLLSGIHIEHIYTFIISYGVGGIATGLKYWLDTRNND